MNSREHTNASCNTKLETSQHTTENAPAFETDMDPIEVLQTLDTFIDTLDGNPSTEDIDTIKNRLTSMAIIAVEYEDKNDSWWMSSPVVLHRYEMKRSMGKRIGHLLKSGGEWKGDTIYKENVEAKWCTDLPMVLAISEDAKAGLNEGRITKLFVGLLGLHQTITNMLEKGESSIGVFAKSDAISYTNLLKVWIESSKNPNLNAMKDGIHAMSLLDVAESMTVSN